VDPLQCLSVFELCVESWILGFSEYDRVDRLQWLSVSLDRGFWALETLRVRPGGPSSVLKLCVESWVSGPELGVTFMWRAPRWSATQSDT
jgi:hypothetical protein